mgnify:CR=1 FL=1
MKLSLDALKERAEATASQALLGRIAGGLEAECHQGSCTTSGCAPGGSTPGEIVGAIGTTISNYLNSLAQFNTGIGGVGTIH